jgi:PPOX class probable F420-dependent enzyme
MLEGWQRDLLETARVARLATISPDGRPHLVPVCYALVEGELVIAVDEKPKRPGTLARVRNITRDPRATLLVDHYADDWDQLVWVRIDARARVLDAGSERPAALDALRTRYLQYREMALEGLPLIILTPEQVVSWRSREP